MRAIHSLSKELAEKIDVARERLSAASWVRASADNQSTDTTLDLYSEPPSAPEPENSRDEQDRTMTVQMLLDTTDPDVLHVASHRECHGLGRIGLVGSTEGATALDRQKEMPTPLPGGNAEREELPWITHSAGERHLSSAGDLRNTLQGKSFRCDTTGMLRCHCPGLSKLQAGVKLHLPLAIYWNCCVLENP